MPHKLIQGSIALAPLEVGVYLRIRYVLGLSAIKIRYLYIMKGGDLMAKKARSAISGKYVKKTYAKRHPKTTVVETDRKKK